jgi:SAM-dependent methyltransferase
VSDIDYSIHYSRFHPDSDEASEKTIEDLKNALAPMLPTDRRGYVVDVGCGFGFAMLALQRLGFENVEGLEVSSQQAHRARQFGLKVAVNQDSSLWLNEQGEKYSVVILRDVLEHTPISAQIPLLRAVYKCLVPGGRAIIQVPNANAILAARWRYIDFTHRNSFTEHSLYFVLRNAGFDRITISNAKGIERPSLRLWRRDTRATFIQSLRRCLVRWCWLQVYKAELPLDRLDDISFELNFTAVAFRDG